MTPFNRDRTRASGKSPETNTTVSRAQSENPVSTFPREKKKTRRKKKCRNETMYSMYFSRRRKLKSNSKLWERRSIIIRLCARAVSHFISSFSFRDDARSPIGSFWPLPLFFSLFLSPFLASFFSSFSLGTKPYNDRERKSRRSLACVLRKCLPEQKETRSSGERKREKDVKKKKETQRGRVLS